MYYDLYHQLNDRCLCDFAKERNGEVGGSDIAT